MIFRIQKHGTQFFMVKMPHFHHEKSRCISRASDLFSGSGPQQRGYRTEQIQHLRWCRPLPQQFIDVAAHRDELPEPCGVELIRRKHCAQVLHWLLRFVRFLRFLGLFLRWVFRSPPSTDEMPAYQCRISSCGSQGRPASHRCTPHTGRVSGRGPNQDSGWLMPAVKVNQKNLLTICRKCSSRVNTGGCLSRSTLKNTKRYDFHSVLLRISRDRQLI